MLELTYSRCAVQSFEHYDSRGDGYVDDWGLQRTLENINYSLTSAHRRLLFQHFGVTINSRRICLFVFDSCSNYYSNFNVQMFCVLFGLLDLP
jgi:hypothetical protein